MKLFALVLAAITGILVATSGAEARRYQGSGVETGSQSAQHRVYRKKAKRTPRTSRRARQARRGYRNIRSNRGSRVRARAGIRRQARAGVRRSTVRRAGVQRRASRSTGGSFQLASLTGGSGVGPRPRKWCGWWMRTQLGGGPQFNLAWNWRHYGSPTTAQVGAVVIWRHHVGIITGQASNGQWIVKSGNDGGRVRERARSVRGAIFRI